MRSKAFTNFIKFHIGDCLVTSQGMAGTLHTGVCATQQEVH